MSFLAAQRLRLNGAAIVNVSGQMPLSISVQRTGDYK